MEKESEKEISLFYKITTLWVICEAFAGGIMHSVKLPFTGMFISSLSVICIVLIAWYTSASYILKATLLVIVFKFSLSPHSPPTAYIAVFFQGLVGYLLFLNKKYFTAAAIILGALALVESAMQRILVLIFLYGNDFWKAVDAYVNKITGAKHANQFSYWIALVYIFIHFIFGIIVGNFAANLVRTAKQWALENPQFLFDVNKLEIEADGTQKNKGRKYFFYFLFLVLILIYLYAWFYPASSILTQNKVGSILLRTALILLGWYLILNPFFTYLFKKYVEKKKAEQKKEFNIIMGMIPEFKKVFIKSWELSAQSGYVKRLKLFLQILILNSLYVKKEEVFN